MYEKTFELTLLLPDHPDQPSPDETTIEQALSRELRPLCAQDDLQEPALITVKALD